MEYTESQGGWIIINWSIKEKVSNIQLLLSEETIFSEVLFQFAVEEGACDG